MSNFSAENIRTGDFGDIIYNFFFDKYQVNEKILQRFTDFG